MHAMPPKDDNMIISMKLTGKGYKMSDVSRQQYTFMLDTRECDASTYENAKDYGFTTICGHEVDLGNIEKNKKYKI